MKNQEAYIGDIWENIPKNSGVIRGDLIVFFKKMVFNFSI